MRRRRTRAAQGRPGGRLLLAGIITLLLVGGAPGTVGAPARLPPSPIRVPASGAAHAARPLAATATGPPGEEPTIARLSPGPGFSSAGWWNSTNRAGSGPTARSGAAMAYDPALGEVVLFGGQDASGPRNDTYSFRSGTWRAVPTPRAPSPRVGAGFAFDAAAGALVLFGGAGPSGALGDTWEFGPAGWNRLAPALAPSNRSFPGVAFDSSSGVLLLFGGLNAFGAPQNDTWSFASPGWSALTPSTPPAARWAGSLIDDPAGAGVLLFGGLGSGAAGRLGDTDLFANGSWNALVLARSPGNRSAASTALDPVGPTPLLFGGATGANGTPASGFWQFAGGGWGALYSPAEPAPRSNASMAWDASDGYLLLFGGENATGPLGDSWIYATAAAVQIIANALETDVGLPILLSANASGGVPPFAFSWSTTRRNAFGPSPASNWTLSIAAPGNVSATVVAGDSVGAVALASLNLSVRPWPSIGILKASRVVDVGQAAGFAANASGGVSPLVVFWTFGDGVASGLDATSHVYGRPGVYTAQAVVRDAVGSNASAASQVLVRPLPRAAVSVDPAAPVVGEAASFRAAVSGGTGGVSLSWSFGDGGTAAGTEVSHTYRSAGLFRIAVNATDAIGGTNSTNLSIAVSASPASPPPSLLLPAAAAGGSAAAALAVAWRVRRSRAARRAEEASTDPGAEAEEPAAELLAEPEVLPGCREQDDEP